MYGVLQGAAEAKCADVAYQRPNFQHRLEERKAHLERELAEINTALDAMKAHPELSQVLNTLSRVNLY